MKIKVWAGVFALSMLLNGCYSMRPSSGGAQVEAPPLGARQVDSSDIALPPGYKIEPVATGLTFPTAATFDDSGQLYVLESGYSYGEVFGSPRLLRVENGGNLQVIATGTTNGPWTGVAFHEGSFYVSEGGVMEGGRILRISLEGSINAIVDQLPSFGDHHTDSPAIGPDGYLYFGQGTASNSGVVGEDNAKFGWLKRKPKFHDIPGRDITLAGHNFTSVNALNPASKQKELTGAYMPYGRSSSSNQVVKGAVKSGGSILRVRPDGSSLELFAWGFRNPFGLAFSPSGELYVTENGYDDRGSRPIWGAADHLWKVSQGAWHGWPDFSGGEPVTLEKFKPPGKPQPQFLLAEHPNQPPQPIAKFGVHSSANGLDFSRNEQFGHVGEAFVALFGDQAPSVGNLLHPVGFKVVRVDVEKGTTEDFAVNEGKKNGPASLLGKKGLERPIAVKFNPAGDALFVVDFGILRDTGKATIPEPNSGVIWRITKQQPQP
ncbi:MAG: PQQ-dependent sugar dehydrogenase [Verrucomicrobiales bacterium]